MYKYRSPLEKQLILEQLSEWMREFIKQEGVAFTMTKISCKSQLLLNLPSSTFKSL